MRKHAGPELQTLLPSVPAALYQLCTNRRQGTAVRRTGDVQFSVFFEVLLMVL